RSWLIAERADSIIDPGSELIEFDRPRLRPWRASEANEDQRQQKQHTLQLEKPRFHRRPLRTPRSFRAAGLISRLRRRTSNRTVSGAAMAHSPPSSSRMAVAVGCMHGNADLRVNGIVP